MNKLVSALITAALIAASGCQVTRYAKTNTDGTKIEVAVKSILTTRTAKKIKFDPVTGAVTIDDLTSGPDRETINDIIKAGAEYTATTLKALAK